ncbi:phosphonate ABC transporter, permease protein PhnE [Dechloromonas sp. XY25]|uniref:Phosphonate ABC transporter, permease protein PhnE n=1 Tax=Dechloromonas hankyongensis TaxID=2908002 RepID=A0ABS9K2M5_9RHOO|nr:phosphonate ABC transporter, permease protein PhnE [Dechloromonas hankyongensis]MCG2577424.1 phosphonate ABC transporter, permease protein PhnE [Dechloromonas hankyongensis]
MLLSTADNHATSDPAARGRLLGVLTALIILWPLFQAAEVKPGALFDPGNLKVIGHFLAAFLPPETGHEFLGYLGKATLETLAIATAGMALAFLLAVPLAYLATAAGRDRPALNPLTRSLLTILRGIPELVWALVFVRVFGLGPAAGVLALGLTYGGMLAKVYAEILESVDATPARALRQTGAGRPLAILYGLLPQASKELASYTVYRWECAIRASVVMGFVGAGGLGQLMDQAMKMLNGGEAASILLAFMVLVFSADGLSGWLRRALDTPPAGRPSPFGWRSLLVALALVGGITASFGLLELGFGELFTADAARSIGEFAASFFPPDLSAEWLTRVGKGVWETLAISVVGTLLAAGTGLLLSLPKPRAPFSFLLNTLRSVPELVWATITALAVGLGPFAGALALALHTSGVLGRLYAEALSNAPQQPGQALRLSGAGNGLAFLYGTLPGAAPQLIAYTLYRWEMNIRMAAILGFVGAGGLGQLLYFELSLFHYAQASTVIIAMLALSIAVDQSSAWLRQRMR